MKFYDTSSLLLKAGTLFDENEEKFAISSITLKELEEIKTSFNKDANIKYAARRLLHDLDEHEKDYEVVVFQESMLNHILENELLMI